MEELYQFATQIKGRATISKRGRVMKQDVLPDYLNFVWSFIDRSKIRPLKVVMDCGNGVAGPIVREVFQPFGLKITEMYFEPDASFPNHEANPIIPENRRAIEAKVKEVGADLGIAWDADADRCYFIDEKGQFVPGDFATAFFSQQFLAKTPGGAIVYDLRASHVVRDTVNRWGGRPLVERVGHSHIKRRMRAEQAVFGGEVSGHYYFAANQFMDNGLIPALLMLEVLSTSTKPLSQLIADLGAYYVSGEINSQVKDQRAALQALQQRYADAQITRLDGISLDYPDWRCNVRPSANDPVLRLNLEANSAELMAARRDEVLALIRRS
jgi:phosphomannomutase